MSAQFAIIIPACDESPCLGEVLRELQAAIEPSRFVIAVGVNGSTDGTAEVARRAGVLTTETSRRGYGYGCQAAIELVEEGPEPVSAFIFFAADGANDPGDIGLLVQAWEEGHAMVLGARTSRAENRSVMGWWHVRANRFLGLWCRILTGTKFTDLGPLRLIERNLFRRLGLREWTFGWTIEAQVRAVALGAKICEIPVRERPRVAGEQKVSRVSWRRSLAIGVEILLAGWRARFRASDRAPVRSSEKKEAHRVR